MTPGEAYTRTRTPHKAANNQHKLGFRQESLTTVNEGTRYPSSVIVFPKTWRPQDQIHGTQKPVALLEYLIRTYSEPGEIVLDNTMGSGSTGVAALRSGRRFIGIERDPTYVVVARARIARAATHPDDPRPDRMVQVA
jgi:DNA modification methylase